MGAEWITALVLGLGIPILLQGPLLPVVQQKLTDRGLTRTNYKGLQVVTAGGLVLVGSSVAAWAAILAYWGWKQVEKEVLVEGCLLLAGLLSMAFWGWLDDVSLDKEAKGFRGHFGVLWRERKVTSGLWKVWGGGCTAMVVAYGLTDSFAMWLLAACLLAVSANLLNLFDLRPARAIKVFWLILLFGAIVSLFSLRDFSQPSVWIWLCPLIVSSLLLFRHDARGEIMLGDTGANALGFAAGFALIRGISWEGQALLLLFFVLLHVLAEFVSFSQIIASVKWLERMDRWGRSDEMANHRKEPST